MLETEDRGDQQDAPHEREFQAERERDQGLAPADTPQRDEDVIERETEAAAAEAARIGGVAGDESEDEAARASYEAGGGEAEGFEQAEEALVEQAEHGDGGAEPSEDEYVLDEEARHVGVGYGDADEIRSTEGVDELEGEGLEPDPEEREGPD
jgi:hypothetical protein